MCVMGATVKELHSGSVELRIEDAVTTLFSTRIMDISLILGGVNAAGAAYSCITLMHAVCSRQTLT
jgi:hypothetical protein